MNAQRLIHPGVKPWFLPSLALLSLVLIQACSNADSLGNEPPVEVQITGTPTFANGVGELLDLKCGYCHAYPLPDLAPDDIVTDLDLTVYDTRREGDLVIRGADSIGRWIHDGILDAPVEKYVDIEAPNDCGCPRQMPLDYGTPLTDAEKDQLLDWSNAGSPRDDTPEAALGDKDAGEDIYEVYCNYCHGSDLEGEPYQDGLLFGAPIRAEAATEAKLQMMWIWSQDYDPTVAPLTAQQVADLRAFLIDEAN